MFGGRDRAGAHPGDAGAEGLHLRFEFFFLRANVLGIVRVRNSKVCLKYFDYCKQKETSTLSCSSPPSPPRTIADFSSAASSGIQTAARTPKQGESIARETPVEPAVPSVTRPPGRSEGGALAPAPAPAPASPTPPLVVAFVASPRIAAATRSLTDPPGLENSALARICILGGREAGGGDLR